MNGIISEKMLEEEENYYNESWKIADEGVDL